MKKTKGRPHRYKREDAIQHIIEMRINQLAPSRRCISFLKDECGYSQPQAYLIYKAAQEQIAKHYEETNKHSLEEAINQLETLLIESKEEGNKKIMLEVLKEISKLKGHYIERIEHSGSVEHKIDVIKIIAPAPKNDDENGDSI